MTKSQKTDSVRDRVRRRNSWLIACAVSAALWVIVVAGVVQVFGKERPQVDQAVNILIDGGASHEMRRLAAGAGRNVLMKTRMKEARPKIVKARKSPDDCIEYVFSDVHGGGVPIIQAPHHKRIQSIFDNEKRAIARLPVEHGKTSQAVFAFCRLLGEYPDRSYGYVQAKFANASKVVGAVKREIESNTNLKRVYPKLMPEKSHLSNALEMWGTSRLRVQGAPAGSKDPSLEAFGLDGQILGSRLHGIVLDNILTRANTASREMRRKVLELIDNEILTRVLPGGFCIILDTTWYADDAVEIIARREGWTVDSFDAEVGMRPEDETLWPSRFPLTRLAELRKTMPESSYNRMYRNKPLSETMGLFRDDIIEPCWGTTAWRESVDWSYLDDCDEDIERPDRIVMGVDLATRKGEEHDLTVLSTGVRIGSVYRLLNVRSDRIEGVEILREIVRTWRDFMSTADGRIEAEIRVEDNAAQKYIVDMMRDAEIMSALGMTRYEISMLNVVGHTTTVKKRDLELGVPGIAGDLEMKRWQIPEHEETDNLRDEMKSWTPEGHTGDRLMSLWILREGLRPSEPDIMVI